MTKNQVSFFLFSLTFFLFSFYLLHGFQFGENNNQEELPLLYESTSSDTIYPNDHFVTFHTSHYTQITPFLSLLATPIHWLDLENIKLYFLLLHLVSLIFYFFVLHLFLHKLVNFNPFQSAVSIQIISIIASRFIPAGRWLFTNFFDPEIITIIIIFYFFYAHLSKKYGLASLCISLAGLLYPIYIIPLYPAIIFLMYLNEFQENKWKSFRILAGYALIPAIYTIFLWTISRQTTVSSFDASYIMEYIRAPWHYKIPSIGYINKKAVGYFILTIPFLIVGKKLLKLDDWSRQLYLLVLAIFGFLLICSVVHSFVRISLLVQISPYRIGLFAVMFTFLLIIKLISHWISRLNLNVPGLNFSLWWTLPATVFLVSGLLFTLNSELRKENLNPSKSSLINWIKENTDQRSLFIDYANVDVRTNCKRSSYFEFKTIPLTADAQLDWYNRFLKYNNFQGLIHPKMLSERIKQDTGPAIQTFGVLHVNKLNIAQNIDAPITHLITYSSDSISLEKKTPVFINDTYAVFKLDK